MDFFKYFIIPLLLLTPLIFSCIILQHVPLDLLLSFYYMIGLVFINFLSDTLFPRLVMFMSQGTGDVFCLAQ